jgi:3-phenylpropionate/cinnamic acid dioxygenase small subunit
MSTLREEVEDFLYHEADLLDERRFSDWLELLAPELRYRVPIAENVHSSDTAHEYFLGDLDVSWLDEGLDTITARVRQIETGIHWAEEPVSRTTHLLTNVRAHEEPDGSVTVRCRMLVHRNRVRGLEDFYIGKRVDRLVRAPDGRFRVAERTVYLDQTTLLANNITTFF